ncbi:MAG: hypothetical protein WCP29_11940 [Acidobacteriota bacterium]
MTLDTPGPLTLGDGSTIPAAVVAWVLVMEAQGVRFERKPHGYFKVIPVGVLPIEDRDFLLEHRDAIWRSLDAFTRATRRPC